MAQYDQLLLFYNQLLNMADEISELIEKELFDDIIDTMQRHDVLVTQIQLAKRCSQLSIEEQNEIDNLQEQLKEKEKNNIEQLQKNMAEVKTELDKLKLRSKLSNAYKTDLSERQGSIIDVDDSYRPEV